MKKSVFIFGIFIISLNCNSQILFSEDFQTTTDLNAAGWTMYTDGFTPNGYQEIFPEAWAVVEWAEESPNSTAATTSSLIEGLAADRWLISPPIAIASNASAVSLTFKARSMDIMPRQDGFVLKISTTTKEKSGFTTALLNVANTPNTMLDNLPFTTVDLSAYAGQTIFLAWIDTFLQGNILDIDAITVSQTTLAKEVFESSKFAVFTNPTTNLISVSSNDNTAITGIGFTDVNGRMVQQNSYERLSNVDVAISDFAAGVYWMKITTSEGSTIKKIIKN